MELNLRESQPGTPVLTGGFSIDSLSWWFWVKAGMGFTLGAGAMYVVFGVLWLYVISRVPSLIFVRALAKF